MGTGFLSGGVVLAIAAALWVIYLMPTWVRRNEYMATERNAVRLQQTLRILAETSETPEEVRVEATAREVAEQQKVLRRVQAEQAERARREALAAHKQATSSAAAHMRRARRRARLTTTLILFAAVVAAGVGGFQVAAGGSVALLASGSVVAVVAVLLLGRMSRVRTIAVPVAVPASAQSAAQAFEPVQFEDAPVAEAAIAWTPQPLPKPLYQSQGSRAAEAMAKADAQAALRRAAIAQVMAERAAQLAPQIPTIAARSTVDAAASTEAGLQGGSQAETGARAAVSGQERIAAASVSSGAREVDSRFAGMGIVDDSEIAGPDVAAMLRARRAAS